ncbi:hypothetical protein BH09ACT10_BH09ACT10_19450 [soil metagenome]
MKAELNGAVVAEAAQEDLVKIEGNWYFPPSSLNAELFTKSPTAYHCPWKGDAQYWNVSDGTSETPDLAWSYPEPIPSSFDRVGQDYSGYVAFDKRISVHE